ncbi:unnamed protein product [Danaus chrysippus]|uniref:(African queen) hypothetical protein n=1 Tax=Danaus chrysippus TaxID=151541 RepID=A0A8J2QRJ1_9NEOP|nr:unnamed protein product [Danaus chrysippus]
MDEDNLGVQLDYETRVIMFFRKILFVLLVATLGSSWFSEGVFNVVDAYRQKYAYPKQYYEQYGISNQQAVAVGRLSRVRQHVRQRLSALPAPQSPSVVFYPAPKDNRYENRPILGLFETFHKVKMCALSLFTICE